MEGGGTDRKGHRGTLGIKEMFYSLNRVVVTEPYTFANTHWIIQLTKGEFYYKYVDKYDEKTEYVKTSKKNVKYVNYLELNTITLC